MLVKDLMIEKVFTVEPNDLIDRVFFLIHYEKIRHLPVIEKQKVIGMVSDRDLYKALGPKSNSNTISGGDASTLHVVSHQVRHIMRRGVLTTSPDAPISEACELMAEHKIGALPVVDSKDKLVGILSTIDLLKVFAKLQKASEAREQRIAEGAGQH
ncbi:MAG: CBS domain-containing protein [Methylococcales bacterium]|nr:CBS domain-containing protein [Methylococcales bacterium]